MKNLINSTTLAILFGVSSPFLISIAKADPVNPQLTADATQAVGLLSDIDAAIPASSSAITKMLNNLYLSYDGLFPTVTGQNIAQLNPTPVAQQNALNITQTDVNNQLMSVSSQIGDAFTNLSLGRMSSLPNPYDDKLYYNLSMGLPSLDTMSLPLGACKSVSCFFQPDQNQLQVNANNFNFDNFFNPLTYANPQQTQYATNYMTFALQTYQPLVPAEDDNAKNRSFFPKLNDYLQNHPDDANNILTNTIMKNVNFQKYWLSLRSYATKRSMVVSNFSYLQAERTAQPGLGAAYGLPTKDVSPREVELDLINQTINNPTWYKSMKTASPGTLQRQQLLLLSLLVRIQQHNEELNERNLATLSLLVSTGLENEREQLKTRGLTLETDIFDSLKK